MNNLPNDWRTVSLSSVAFIQTGLAKGGKQPQDAVELPYLRVANVQDGYFDLSEIKTIAIDRKQIDRYALREGDVLLTEGGDFDKLGRGTVWRGEISVCLHQNHLFAVRLDRNQVLPEFFALQVSGSYGRSYFLNCAKRSTNLASINKAQLSEYPVLLPPLPEQRKIAEILGTWDAAIEHVARLIAALQRRKQGLMQRLLTGKVRFPEFAGEAWQERSIGELLQEMKRPLNIESEKEYALASVRRRSEGIFFRESRKGRELTSSEMYQVRSGDFLISKRQIVHGASALVTPEFNNFLVSNSYHVLAAQEGLDIRYFAWLSKTPLLYHYAHVASHGVHIEKLFFTLDTYFQQRVRVPTSLDEQQKIVTTLDCADEHSQKYKLYLAALRQQKQGLMQRLLTGQVRVPLAAAADAPAGAASQAG